MKQLIFLLAVVLSGTLNPAAAQIRTPQPSPLAKVTQDVGLTKVDLEYSRPSARGRKIFGDLVPFGEMWRTGANASTKITVGDDMMVGTSKLPKGTYALYTTPGQNEWQVIFYKNTTFGGTPGKDFNESDVVARYTAKTTVLKDPVETFTINFNNLRNNGADLDIMWETTKVSIPLTMDTDSKVMADIKAQMAGPSANTYYSAARYYYDEKKDMAQALTWLNKSMELGGEKFWMLRLKAQILAEQGNYKAAIEAANRSTELAKADANADYPRMNEKSIAEWTKKAGNKK